MDFDAIREAAGVKRSPAGAYTQGQIETMLVYHAKAVAETMTMGRLMALDEVDQLADADELAEAVERARDDFSVETTDALDDALEAYREGRGSE